MPSCCPLAPLKNHPLTPSARASLRHPSRGEYSHLGGTGVPGGLETSSQVTTLARQVPENRNPQERQQHAPGASDDEHGSSYDRVGHGVYLCDVTCEVGWEVCAV